MMKIPCSVWMPSLIKKYRHADGTDISISRICWDIGGIDAEIVYKRSKKTRHFPRAACQRGLRLRKTRYYHA